jgi:hypothetical protein
MGLSAALFELICDLPGITGEELHKWAGARFVLLPRVRAASTVREKSPPFLLTAPTDQAGGWNIIPPVLRIAKALLESNALPTLDFSKLDPPRGETPATPKGETFEGLIRLLGQRLGMVAESSGRGPDGGRDLFFVETQQGPINARSVRWLVSCKDNSDSNRSVTERDIGSVTDKIQQHKCGGFLLATTTTASTGLKELLDKLDSTNGGPMQTKVWDRHDITQMLLSDRCADLLLQYFPEHHRREAVARLDAAREVVEAHLPRFVVGQVRAHLVPRKEREALLSGSKVWPHDADQQTIIDTIMASLANSWFDEE